MDRKSQVSGNILMMECTTKHKVMYLNSKIYILNEEMCEKKKIK